MNLPELPPPYPTMRNQTLAAQRNFSPLEFLAQGQPNVAYTADQMRAFYAEGFRAGMERAAVIASAHSKEPLHPDVPFADQDDKVTHIAHWQAQNIAAAIRTEAASIEKPEKLSPSANNGG